MRYVMKQKVWALGNDYVVRDEAGNDRFIVDGRAWSIGDKLSLTDMAGNELAFIRQKLLSWGPTYELYHRGQLFAVVKESLWTFVRYRFAVDVGADGATPNDLEIQGDFWDKEYAFTRVGDGVPVAQVSRKWFAWVDTYGVDVADDRDAVLVLACAVVVDLCVEKHKKND
jgi:uncharacterized protein YxjI